jgi:hypothetical protein
MERTFTLRQNVVVVSILASLWLLKHPYNGIWHDGVLYTFLALSRLHPGSFAGDLFLKFGSQDSYTIFSPIYAIFIKVFGIYASAALLTILGQLFWISAAIAFFRTFFKGKELFIALAVVFFVRSHYGGFNAFQFAEPFVTPRIFSEAFCIFGATAMLKERNTVATVIFLISFFVHPLMTIGAGLIVYVYLVLKNPKVIVLAPAAAGAIFFLGLLKIEPFSGIFRTLSPAWMQVVQVRSSFMFLFQWSLTDWVELFFTFSITIAALLIVEGIYRRLLTSAVIGACCGMLLNIIGGEILKNELIMQLQTWRTLWFMQFVSAAALSTIVFYFLNLKKNKVLLISFLVLAWYSRTLGAVSFGVSALFLFLTILSLKDRLPRIELARPVISIIAVMVLLDLTSFSMLIIRSNFNSMILFQITEYAMLNTLLPLILCLVIFLFFHRWIKIHSLKIAAAALAFLIFSVAVWDRQSAWSRMLESNQDAKAFFRDVLPVNATILWDGSSQIPWFGAERLSYISAHQGSGAVFHQETALEYEKRVNSILCLLDQNPLKSAEIGYKLTWRIDQKKFKANYSKVCRDAEGLDYIVSPIDVQGRWTARWHSAVPMENVQFFLNDTFERTSDQDFYLYDCSDYKVVQATR